MAVVPLSDVALKALKPRDKFYKVSVGGDGVGGLHILVFPSGTKVFNWLWSFARTPLSWYGY